MKKLERKIKDLAEMIIGAEVEQDWEKKGRLVKMQREFKNQLRDKKGTSDGIGIEARKNKRKVPTT